ncbi:MAG: cbb3-type cytochrome oxidase assembly protein CcoS [Chromatiales bacterium]|nr:cbb3-type cytochrome oxidase assembly protein CcoS [Chromatiales bacterium]
MVAGFICGRPGSGQFDDLEGPAHRILMDEDEPQEPPPRRAKPGRQARDVIGFQAVRSSKFAARDAANPGRARDKRNLPLAVRRRPAACSCFCLAPRLCGEQTP